MKKILCMILVLLCFFLVACAKNTPKTESEEKKPAEQTAAESGEQKTFVQITPQDAKKIMDSAAAYVVLDVREQTEFDEGHIPGAIVIPHTEIEAKAAQMLPDKNALILVYCRSGRRSKLAAESLVKLGYTDVKEFGGIVDWPYETVK